MRWVLMALVLHIGEPTRPTSLVSGADAEEGSPHYWRCCSGIGGSRSNSTQEGCSCQLRCVRPKAYPVFLKFHKGGIPHRPIDPSTHLPT